MPVLGEEVKKVFDNLEKQLKDVDAQLKAKQVELKGLHGSVGLARESARVEIEKVKADTQKQIAELNDQVIPYRSKIDALASEYTQKLSAVELLDRQIQDSKAEIGNLAQKMKTVNAEIAERRGVLASIEAELQRVKQAFFK